MAKHTKEVLIAYDSDEAGQNATRKAIRMLSEVGLEVRVLHMEGAKDPDEYIKKYGADSFRALLDAGKTGFEFKLDATLRKYDISTPDGKIKASKELCDYISEVHSGVEREVYIAITAKRLGLSEEGIKNDVASIRKKKMVEYNAGVSRQARNEAMGIGDRINSDGIKNIKARTAEETIIGLMLLFEEYRSAVMAKKVELYAEDFFSDFHRRAFERICSLEADGGYDFSLLGEFFSPEEMGRLEGLVQKRRELTENGLEVLRGCAETLRKEKKLSGQETIDAIQLLIASKRGAKK
jgi:DNA primase